MKKESVFLSICLVEKMLAFRQKLGKFGEKLACKYLRERGYKIVDQNYRTRNGEIDIVAEEGKILVFIEVKTRTSRVFGFPEEAIDVRKQYKLAKTAEHYLMAHRLYDRDYRIDSFGIEIDGQNKKARIRHKKDVVGW